MFFKTLPLLSFLIFISFLTEAQSSNQKCKWVTTFDEAITLDSLSVHEASIRIENSDSTDVSFQYDLNYGKIRISPESNVDSVRVCYTVFPYSFHSTYAKRTLNEYDSNARFKANPSLAIAPQKEQLFETDNLYKSGSISRGISFGNRQNVIVNSTLNLQMEGKLADNINIRASITDQNVPYQPEGNTQQIQEFDNVFVELYNDKSSLTVGDIILNNKQDHFLRYNRNTQGGKFKTSYKIGDAGKAVTSLGIGVAKGRFASIQLPVLEGVQGPYRLNADGQGAFTLVLANSERVFLDGQLLRRGFDNDYIIDYNLGEITFTTRVLITKFSRVRVDYEFSDRNYNRTVLAAEHQLQMGKMDFSIGYFSQKDNRNRPVSFDFTNADKIFLSELGDNQGQAVLPGIDSVVFDSNFVLYKKIDSVFEGQTFEVYKFSTNPDSAFYRLSFSNVGEGKGNYVQTSATTNGTVFSWVAPQAGVMQGSFEPILLVATPEKKSLLSSEVGFQVGKNERIFAGIAIAQEDLNLFSELDDNDNQANAYRLGMELDSRPISFLEDYTFQGLVSFELLDKNFSGIDRFRPIEFNRDWSFNASETEESPEDKILDLSFVAKKSKYDLLSYRLTARDRDDQIDGWQQALKFNKSFGKLRFNNSFFHLQSDQAMSESEWVRLTSGLSLNGGVIVPGYIYDLNKNKVTDQLTGNLVGSANYFEEHKVYIKSHDSLTTQFNFSYSYREDQLPQNEELKKNNRANTIQGFIGGQVAKNQHLNLQMTYRKLENLNIDADEKNEETISGQLSWRASLLNEILDHNLTYAVGNGRELRREFIFLAVPTGEGTHTWRDDNGDGQQDLNEFYEAINIDERNYAKIFVPTNDFILAFTNNFNYLANIRLPATLRERSAFLGFVQKLSNTTTWNIDKKTLDNSIEKRFNPFINDLNDEDIIAVREILRSTFYFNRSSTKFGINFTILSSAAKQQLTNGFESRESKEHRLNLRFGLNSRFNLLTELSDRRRSNFSDFLENRNYLIKGYRAAQAFSWQPNQFFRASIKYTKSNNSNELNAESFDKANTDEFMLALKGNKTSKGTLDANFRYINIDFTGEENTAAGYVLLEALRPGENMTWNVNWQQKVANGLRLTLSYFGRKSSEQNTVHTGSMRLSALF